MINDAKNFMEAMEPSLKEIDRLAVQYPGQIAKDKLFVLISARFFASAAAEMQLLAGDRLSMSQIVDQMSAAYIEQIKTALITVSDEHKRIQ